MGKSFSIPKLGTRPESNNGERNYGYGYENPLSSNRSSLNGFPGRSCEPN